MWPEAELASNVAKVRVAYHQERYHRLDMWEKLAISGAHSLVYRV